MFLILILLHSVTAENRCGKNWNDAVSRCGTACPGGIDYECPSGERCYGQLSTCNGVPGAISETENLNYLRCGVTWSDAFNKCGTPCPNGLNKECSQGENCFSGLNPCNSAVSSPVGTSSANDPIPEKSSSSVPGSTTTRCGKSWFDANDNCYADCVNNDGCKGLNLACWADLSSTPCSGSEKSSPLPVTPLSSEPEPLVANSPTSDPPKPPPVEEVTSSNLAKEEQDAVDAHNKHRRQQNQPLLSWDSNLAAASKSWAETLAKQKCQLIHDHNPTWNQNLAMWASFPQAPSETFADAVSFWMTEPLSQNEINHAWIVALSGTKRFGCGKASGPSDQYTCLVVACDYQ